VGQASESPSRGGIAAGRRWLTGAVLASVLVVATIAAVADSGFGRTPPAPKPPPKGGYFGLEPVGVYASLPQDEEAAAMVHRSAWEPRPDNRRYNETVPTGLALVPKNDADLAYDPRWNTHVQDRITGNFTGTTDEIIQWAAAKWGVPDDVLRAMALMESTWDQSNYGDFVDDPSECPEPGQPLPCPVSFGLVGVKSSSWPGIYPWNRDSTAAGVDVLGGWLRGCYEGWIWWLRDHGNRSRGVYGPGDLWGCVGSWYSGDWHDGSTDDVHSGEGYLHQARQWYETTPWLAPDF
jgi:hypothetical protein